MNKFISSGVFRQYVGLLSLAVTLPETATLTIEGVTREFVVAHKIELQGYEEGRLSEATLLLTSWAILPVTDLIDNEASEEIVDAEAAWANDGVFWIGAPKRIYRDSNPPADKRWGGFSWCGNTERELVFPTFTLVKNGPLFNMIFRLPSLIQFGGGNGKMVKTAVNVGTVHEDGSVTLPDGQSRVSATPFKGFVSQEPGPVPTATRRMISGLGGVVAATFGKPQTSEV